jgi:hypothetical protein
MADLGNIGRIIQFEEVVIPVVDTRLADAWVLEMANEDSPRPADDARKLIAGRCVDQYQKSIARRVMIYRDDNGLLVGDVTSSATDGAFSAYVDDVPSTTYTVYMQPLSNGDDRRNAPIYTRVTPV